MEAGLPCSLERDGDRLFKVPSRGDAAMTHRHGGMFYRTVKRTFDIVFSAGVVAVTLVPSALLCLAIRLDTPGPAVYAQERIGRGGRVIRVYKLRSMVVDADDVERYLDEKQLAQWKAERKVDKDPRITRVGHFIRSTSLDELPQFWNVLRGEMSVVGPRPVTQAEISWYGDFVDEILSVRPGITGLWQAGARNGATFESGERQRIELEYVRSAGFGTDIRCIFDTFGAMFGKRKTGR